MSDTEPTTSWVTEERCPECSGPVRCTMGTHLMCENIECPFEMGSCSGRWVDVTEYNRSLSLQENKRP